MQAAATVEKAGVFGWGYNRANFKFDQTLRWTRFTTGRKMAIAQVGLFRQDCTDLAAVAQVKMKTYAPILTMSLGYCITVFVEGRSGLKFPGPPVFVSGIYLQCLGIGFAFMTLATWLVFHAALRAQIAAVQLRTRIVRVPVPTQRHLDGARKLLSTWEENSLYDMFKVPFVMPNSAEPDGNADAPPTEEQAPLVAGKRPKKPLKGGKAQGAGEEPSLHDTVRMPGLTKGAPSWLEKEMAQAEAFPNASPSGHGKDGPSEPLDHFELLRQAQREYWGAEAYCRVCFLFGMMHLIHSFAYWLVLHNIAELGMVWCANVCAAGLTAGVWLMFRLDVLPDYGGCFPVEAAGPFVTAIALTMMYTGHYTVLVLDIARALAVVILGMHVLWTYRLYSVAKPANTILPSEQAKESGGRLFNESASCALPAWLPRAFQHCTYLVAPPKPKRRVEMQAAERAAGETTAALQSTEAYKDDPIAQVDMTPWYYTRAVLFTVLVGWLVLLTGRISELATGERMLVTNPGAPPWSRTGQWYGWEHGPISSKHYAHVTPQRGHWAWQKGWGPQGQQELWASDMFGFAPEADAWWAETVGPEPRVGAAGIGENTWSKGLLAYGTNEEGFRPAHSTEHDWLGSGGHRRLRSAPRWEEEAFSEAPAVPLAVQWPAFLEPDVLACGPGGAVLALTNGGTGALVPPGVASGRVAGGAVDLALKGLVELGMARGVTWVNSSLHIVTGSGALASCPGLGPQGGSLQCTPWQAVPKLPSGAASVLLERASPEAPLRAAVAEEGSLFLLELRVSELLPNWEQVQQVVLPDIVPVALSHSAGQLVLLGQDGAAFSWKTHGNELVGMQRKALTAAGARRAWRSACALPGGKAMRLAANWRKAAEGGFKWHPELLL